MKVREGVTFRFRFLLHDNERLGILAKDKLNLFEQLVLLLGMGAKTAVGYGQFFNEKKYLGISVKEEVTDTKTGTSHGKKPDFPKKPKPDKNPINYTFKAIKRAARRADHITGKVTDNQNQQITVDYLFEGSLQTTIIPYPRSEVIEVGRLIRMKVKDAGSSDLTKKPVFQFGGYAN